MSATDIIAIIIVGTCSVVTMALAFVFARMLEGPATTREVHSEDTDLASVNAEVVKLRAEIKELRRTRRPSSTFMDMADALNRITNPPATYDEASLEVPLMDLALGKVVKVRLLSGKEVSFIFRPRPRAEPSSGFVAVVRTAAISISLFKRPQRHHHDQRPVHSRRATTGGSSSPR